MPAPDCRRQHIMDNRTDPALTQFIGYGLLRELSEIGRMLHSMIEHSSAFCTKNSDSVRENIPGNFESPDSPNSEPR